MKHLQNLSSYIGTEEYHRLTPFAKFVCTDGIKYVANDAGAYWLIDAIASYQPKLKHAEFQHWKLTVNDSKAVLTCDDGNDNILITQHIEYTDFPLTMSFYLTNGVLMLTSEY